MTVTRRKDNRNENAITADVLSNGYFVSTVRLYSVTNSLDSFLSLFPIEGRADLSTPGDYETMVFECLPDGVVNDWTELDFRRYITEQDALEGHEEIVKKWMLRN